MVELSEADQKRILMVLSGEAVLTATLLSEAGANLDQKDWDFLGKQVRNLYNGLLEIGHLCGISAEALDTACMELDNSINAKLEEPDDALRGVR